MGSFGSSQRRQRQYQARANATNARIRGQPASQRGGNDTQPQMLMLGNHHVQYRQNPGGPVIFYVDQQQYEAPPSEVQETVKVKNHVNLLKQTLALVATEDANKFFITFHADTLVDCDCTIFFAAEERWNDTQGLHFVFQDSSLTGAVQGPVKVPAETDYVFTSTSMVNVKEYPMHLFSDELNPPNIPVAIMLQYDVPGGDAMTPSSTRTKQSQITYCQIVQSSDSGNYQLKFLRQRLQLADLSVFDLEDIYGVMGCALTAEKDDAAAPSVYSAMPVGGDECVICLANERDTTVMPCRHMCLCGMCAEVLRRQTNKCPICRTVIECLMTLKKEPSKA